MSPPVDAERAAPHRPPAPDTATTACVTREDATVDRLSEVHHRLASIANAGTGWYLGFGITGDEMVRELGRLARTALVHLAAAREWTE